MQVGMSNEIVCFFFIIKMPEKQVCSTYSYNMLLYTMQLLGCEEDRELNFFVISLMHAGIYNETNFNRFFNYTYERRQNIDVTVLHVSYIDNVYLIEFK